MNAALFEMRIRRLIDRPRDECDERDANECARYFREVEKDAASLTEYSAEVRDELAAYAAEEAERYEARAIEAADETASKAGYILRGIPGFGDIDMSFLDIDIDVAA
jgi:hypothetical protein